MILRWRMVFEGYLGFEPARSGAYTALVTVAWHIYYGEADMLTRLRLRGVLKLSQAVKRRLPISTSRL